MDYKQSSDTANPVRRQCCVLGALLNKVAYCSVNTKSEFAINALLFIYCNLQYLKYKKGVLGAGQAVVKELRLIKA